MYKTQFIKFLALPFFLLISLIGCAERVPEGGGAGDTTPVTFSFNVPSEGNRLSKAFATAPSSIASVELRVTNGLNQQIAITVIPAVPGQTVTTTFNVPSGLDRIFKAIAKNASGTALYEGTSDPQTLDGQPVSINIPMKVVEATTGTNALSVKVVGLVKETDPISGIRVLLNDPVTGAFIREVTTDTNGLADFGNITLARVTLTVQGAVLKTLMDVPTDAYTVTLGPGPSSTPQASFSPTISNIPTGFTEGFLTLGNFTETSSIQGSVLDGTLNIPSVNVVALKPNGKFDLLARLEDRTTPRSFCGYQDDLDPFTVEFLLPSGTAFTSAQKIPFTTNPPVPVKAYGLFLRDGSLYEIGPGTSALSESGTVQFCEDAKVTHYDVIIETSPTEANPTEVGVDLIFNRLPTETDLTGVALPNIAIAPPAYNAATQTFSWDTSGADAGQINFGNMDLSWTDGVNGPVKWEFAFSPTEKQLKLPQLPQPTSGTTAKLLPAMPPATGVSFELYLSGNEPVIALGAVTYDRMISRLNTHAFNGEKAFLKEIKKSIFAFREGVTTEPPTTGDQTAPVISNLPNAITVAALNAEGTPETNSAIQAFLNAPTATDDVDGTVTVTNNAPATFSLVGTTIVTFTATDAAGNSSSFFREVSVTDQTGPVLTPPITIDPVPPAMEAESQQQTRPLPSFSTVPQRLTM